MPASQSNPIQAHLDSAVESVRPLVIDRLRRVEQDRGLRVVFACESGSRAWGFASNDSDFDVRFIYTRPAKDYLKLNPPSDAFDIMGDAEFDLDLAGWDIRKTAELMKKSNGPLFEWLESPIIYEQDGDISTRLIQLREAYFDPKKATYHYLSLARGVWKKYIADEATPVRKKYLYTLRPFACIQYIDQFRKHPPTSFDAVLSAIDLKSEVREAIASLVEDKKNNRELGAGPADPVLNQWIKASLISSEQLAEKLLPTNIDNSLLDQLVADAILGKG